ncbi:MAG: amidophosphoribosyltransferase, partial [Leptospira sp.]|nr:amidophosphoribosyltransferase [Leptospira sp.]
CIFEYIYFSRPDSYIFGESVYKVRKSLGAFLARELPVEADVVIPVPDSANIAAQGYSEESGIPFRTGLIRSHYVGRTFIEPDQKIRDFGAKIKYNVVREVIEGKKVIVVDDSIMRGTTSRKIIKMIRAAGAKEIHMRVSAPPTISPCYYGIDIPTHAELIASSHTIEEIRKYLRVDSLAYLKLDSMHQAVEGHKGGGFCDACFTEKYPIEFHSRHEGNQKSLFQEYAVEES